MDIPIAKEVLIATSELGLTNGEYVFIAIETDLEEMHLRQTQPFTWSSADFGLENETFDQFIARSKLLCKALEVKVLLF